MAEAIGVVDSSRLGSLLGAGSQRSPLRALGTSLYGAGAEERVVLDVGEYTLRAGFSGDSAPLLRAAMAGDYERVGTLGRLSMAARGLDIDDDALNALVLEQLRAAYRGSLLVDAKARKVALVVGALTPGRLRQAIVHALMGPLRVAQVTMYPASVAALVTCGGTAGLVVDCGHRTSTVVPVYDARPMSSLLTVSPMAGRALWANLRGLLVRYASFEPAGESGGSVTEDMLDDALCERLLQLLYVSPVAVPESMRDHVSVGKVQSPAIGWFQSSVTATATAVRVTLTRPPGRLLIPCWVRERVAEVLLVGDSAAEHMGLVDAIVQCLARVPMDLRRHLVSRILVVGGVADMPNFRMRLLQDVVARLRQGSRWSALANDAALAEERATAAEPSSANGSVFRPSDRCWIGTSLAVAAKIGGVDVKSDGSGGYSLPDSF
ncbi:hypothetical protein GGF46_001054 [Coemansia sp. RSA 552]|nr:hypothetical protein GGF46_001054 [Coemansia sp. RSA 552]